MTKLPVRAVLLWVVSLSSLAWADYMAVNWQFRRAVTIPSASSIATIRLDPIVYKGSAARLADLRILRDTVERPYVLETLRGTASETELQPRIVDKSVWSNSALQLTLDLGAPAASNRLRLTTSEHNFKQRVRIETSNDNKRWAVARDDGYIFDFSQDARRVSVLSIDYPVSTRRYVRVTIFGWKDPKLVETALLTRWLERPDTRDSYAAFDKLTPVQDSKTQSTAYTVDLGYEGLPHDQLELNVAEGLFYRAIEIETGRDGKEWAYAGQGVVYRMPEQQSLTVSFGEVWDRYLRFRIMNGDDQPLAVTRVAIDTIARQVQFQAGGAVPYWLAYGNADAKAPAYDLNFVIPKMASAVSPASLGPEQANPGYRPKPPAVIPWSDRHPGVLYGVLGVAVAAMGLVTIRFLMKVSAERAGSGS